MFLPVSMYYNELGCFRFLDFSIVLQHANATVSIICILIGIALNDATNQIEDGAKKSGWILFKLSTVKKILGAGCKYFHSN